MSRDFHDLVDALYELQDERCGICGYRGRLVVDHDHGSGMVRGLLCSGCNTREGKHGVHSPHACPTCMWRRQPAVSWLGWTVHYSAPIDIPWTGFVHTAERVKENERHGRRCAEIMGRLLPGAFASNDQEVAS